jgi:chromosome segregation ATPase
MGWFQNANERREALKRVETANKAAKQAELERMDALSKELVDLREKKKALELEVDSIAAERAKFEQEMKMKTAELEHTHKLKLEEMTSLTDLETKQYQAKIKIEGEKRILQMMTDHQIELADLRSAHASEVAKIRSELAEKHHDKLGEVLTETTVHGTQQAKFAQDLSIKMMEKALEKPQLGSGNVTVNQGKEDGSK